MLLRRRAQKPVLHWGIRESLTSYIVRLPDGEIRADEGADFVTRTHPPQFRFPLSFQTTQEARFDGAVEMIGHGGLLHVLARRPWLHFVEDSILLSIEPANDGTRIEVAVADVVAPTPTGWSVAARLTAAGAHWLGPNYSPGDSASAITLRNTPSSATLRKIRNVD